MSHSQTGQEVDTLVNQKVRKRVAKKVMRDIHKQVDEIDQQIQIEQKTAKFLLPLLFFFAFIIVMLFANWADLMRLLSGLIY